MKKAEVKLGGRYTAKVSDRLTTVRIDAASPHGGWDATNLATKKKVRIKSAQRLRGPAPRAAQAAAGTGGDAPAAEAGPDAPRANVGREGADTKAAKAAKVEAWRKEVAEKAKKPDPALDAAFAAAEAGAKAKASKKAPKEKRPSLLDLAAEVLAKAKEPMDCKAIVEQVLATGRWTTKGKTPTATLYSAILRECQKKGKDARFQKVERGQFTVK